MRRCAFLSLPNLVALGSFAPARGMHGVQGNRFTYSHFSTAAVIPASRWRKVLVFPGYTSCDGRVRQPFLPLQMPSESALSTKSAPDDNQT